MLLEVKQKHRLAKVLLAINTEQNLKNKQLVVIPNVSPNLFI
jgi:hypothetical protein